MRKTFTTIKEALQYVGIITVSCLSALWLLMTSRRKK